MLNAQPFGCAMLTGHVAELLLLLTPLSLLLVSILYFSDHKIRIQRVGLRSLYIGGISYTRISSGTTTTCAGVTLHPHFPSPSSPYWAISVARGFEYKDTNCHVSIAEVKTKLWVFPLLFRFTGGSWVTSELEGFRIRVFASTHTPRYIQKMRENVISAVLKGEVLRLDEFTTEIKLGGISKFFVIDEEAEDPNTSAGDEDEVRITATGSQYHILTKEENRYYTFGHAVAQLRRNWSQGTGTLVMVVKGSRWTRVHPPQLRRSFSFFSKLALAIFQFPIDLFTLYERPMTFVDIYVTQADITFDDFRVRDMQLVVQGLTMLQQHARSRGFDMDNEWVNVLLDMLFKTR